MTEPAPQPAAPQPAAPLSEAEDKQWASFAHFGNIISLIPPLIIWLVFKDRGAKTNVEGKEATNWGINVAGILIINGILSLILVPLTFGIWVIISTLIWIVVVVVNLIFAILGGVKVNGGGSYRYPVNIRWIK
jgi:uncharacterized Tic20 family protein